ncbi:hypothetical protein DIPPA_16532, partial [Diplonema papillatum]
LSRGDGAAHSHPTTRNQLQRRRRPPTRRAGAPSGGGPLVRAEEAHAQGNLQPFHRRSFRPGEGRRRGARPAEGNRGQANVLARAAADVDAQPNGDRARAVPQHPHPREAVRARNEEEGKFQAAPPPGHEVCASFVGERDDRLWDLC